jgi:hypothetical protein
LLLDSSFFGSLCGVVLGLAALEDEDEGAWLLGGGVGVVAELLELEDGPESARGDIGAEEPGLLGVLPGLRLSCLSQPASATAPTLSATRSLIMSFFMGSPWG